ncbi:hypothetical protein PENTCL1PPCAC_27699, partial [Pristionchus entomophagus]
LILSEAFGTSKLWCMSLFTAVRSFSFASFPFDLFLVLCLIRFIRLFVPLLPPTFTLKPPSDRRGSESRRAVDTVDEGRGRRHHFNAFDRFFENDDDCVRS